jgi:hypothetical protein
LNTTDSSSEVPVTAGLLPTNALGFGNPQFVAKCRAARLTVSFIFSDRLVL